MKLNRRNLYFKVPPEDGDDVRTLQIELRLLGIPTPEDEIRKGYFGIGTHKAVVEFQRKFGSNLSNGVNGVVDNLTAELLTEQVSSLANIEQLKRFQVRGIVRNENGEPVTNLIVKAYDMDLRPPPTELGVTTTDADGKYQIDYSSSQFKRAEKDSADLFVRVYRSNNQEPLIESLKIFNSPPVTTVDLTIGDTQFVGISEYEQILIEVTPLMQGVTWSQINENKETQDISFITSETGLSREKIDYLVIANKLAQTTKLPAESFYGLFRSNLPTDLDALLLKSIREYRQALEIALQKSIIPFKVRRELDRIIEGLRQLKLERAFEESNERARIRLGGLLSSAIMSEDKTQKKILAQKFFMLYSKYEEDSKPIQEFWKDLRENHPDLREHVDNLQMSFQLSAITHGHWPLIKKIQSMQHDGKIKNLRDLSNLDKDDWILLIRSKSDDNIEIGCPEDMLGEGDDRIKNYATIITHIFEDAFPTTVFTRRLEKHNLPINKDVVTFFRNNQNFDLKRDYVEKYLKDNPKSTIGINNVKVFTTQLKKYQRVFKLTPRYEELQVLINDGLESAYSISKMGRNVFNKKYSRSIGGEQRANMIYDNALRVSAMAMRVFTTLSPRFNGAI